MARKLSRAALAIQKATYSKPIEPLPDYMGAAVGRRILYGHDHNAADARDPLTRENCAACVLYAALNSRAKNPRPPNYAGSALVYLQNGLAWRGAWNPDNLRAAINDSARTNAGHCALIFRHLRSFPCPNRHVHHVGAPCEFCCAE